MKKLKAMLLELMGLKRVNVVYQDENDQIEWIDRQFMFDVPRKKDHIQKDKKYYIVDLIVFDYDYNELGGKTVFVMLKRY